MIRMSGAQALRLLYAGLELPHGSAVLCDSQEQVNEVYAAARRSPGDATVMPEPPATPSDPAP